MSNDRSLICAYLLPIMAAAPPFNFMTGLLGANLNGSPGQDNPLGLLGLTIGLALFLMMIFHRLQWLRPIQRLQRQNRQSRPPRPYRAPGIARS